MQTEDNMDINIINPQIEIQPSFSKMQSYEQSEQARCRICYDDIGPLVQLCECSGSIGYVHEICILDWITKKIEASDNIQIPKCEICHSIYSARMTVGRKKLSYDILISKLKALKRIEIIILFLYILGFIVAVYTFFSGFYFAGQCIGYLLIQIKENNQQVSSIMPKSMLILLGQTTINCFIYLVFPYKFIQAAGKYYRKQRYLIESSMVQVIEVTLLPKRTIL